jgi:hypothetical protein
VAAPVVGSSTRSVLGKERAQLAAAPSRWPPGWCSTPGRLLAEDLTQLSGDRPTALRTGGPFVSADRPVVMYACIHNSGRSAARRC